MDDARAAARQQRVEALCAASIRALTGERALHYRAQRLHRGRRMVAAGAPHLRPTLDDDDFASFRGAADGLALHLLHSNAALHERMAPRDPVERLVFDMLEQYRVESLLPAGLNGLRENLRHRFEAWSQRFAASSLLDGERGLLLFAIAQIGRTRVTGDAIDEEHADRIEATRFALHERIGHELGALRRTRHSQAAYAVPALSIAGAIGAMVSGGDEGRRFLRALRGDDEDPSQRGRFALLLNVEGSLPEVARAAAGSPRDAGADDAAYRAYTRAYDRECHASALVRAERLRTLRQQLDARIARQGVNVARLARELKALFATPERDGWRGGEEEGRIDGARLAQLVASPAERRLFRTEPPRPVVNAAVAVLIDCSGSMKQHIEAIAMWADVLARALEQAGAVCEVLGFTTSAYNGGRAARDWQREGRPRHPGRLNETLHIVFKDAATPWRRARAAMAALLDPALFREGVDGEAVAWAAQRLLAREEARRCLIVISDGSPMDSATMRANGEHFLDEHLRDVVQAIERAGQLEIAALGVALDLSATYSRSRVVDAQAPSGHHAFQDILELLAGRGWR